MADYTHSQKWEMPWAAVRRQYLRLALYSAMRYVRWVLGDRSPIAAVVVVHQPWSALRRKWRADQLAWSLAAQGVRIAVVEPATDGDDILELLTALQSAGIWTVLRLALHQRIPSGYEGVLVVDAQRESPAAVLRFIAHTRETWEQPSRGRTLLQFNTACTSAEADEMRRLPFDGYLTSSVDPVSATSDDTALRNAGTTVSVRSHPSLSCVRREIPEPLVRDISLGDRELSASVAPSTRRCSLLQFSALLCGGNLDGWLLWHWLVFGPRRIT